MSRKWMQTSGWRHIGPAVAALILTASPAWTSPSAASSNRRIVVTSTIQAAVDAAAPGDTVVVPPGTYREAVVVAKSSLRIEGPPTAVIDATGFANGITVGTRGITRSNGVPTCAPMSLHDVSVRGLTVRNAQRNGILLRGVDGFRVTGGTYRDNDRYGIFPSCSRNGVVEGNRVDGSNDAGIYVGNSAHVAITANHVSDCTVGIEIENASAILTRGNRLTGNTAGVLVFVIPNLPVAATEDIVLVGNEVRANNRRNPASPGSGQPEALVPVGTGILSIGSDHVAVHGNHVSGNDSIGVGVIRNPIAGQDPRVDPEPDHNRVVGNVVLDNGGAPDAERTGGIGADLLHDGSGTGNCFAGNVFRTELPPGLTASSSSCATDT